MEEIESEKKEEILIKNQLEKDVILTSIVALAIV
jgi:hypothetical protein